MCTYLKVDVSLLFIYMKRRGAKVYVLYHSYFCRCFTNAIRFYSFLTGGKGYLHSKKKHVF